MAQEEHGGKGKGREKQKEEKEKEKSNKRKMKRAEGKRQKVTRVSKGRTSEWAKKGVKVEHN